MASPFNILPGNENFTPAMPLPETHPRPDWLKVRFFGGANYQDLKSIMRTLGLHTVCESARCPNMGECWEHRTATFMILGNICTRACGFCAVPSGKPIGPPEEDEPERVAEAVAKMGLRYAVVTSVNRDDQPDGGSAIFARTIQEIRRRVPGCSVEVLIPDFRGEWSALETVLQRAARRAESQHGNRAAALSRSSQRRDLRALAGIFAPRERIFRGNSHEDWNDAGLGETRDEVIAAMADLAAQHINILTLGQYMQPTREHLPIVRYVHPDEFAEYKQIGEQMGFRHVESGPLVRSSYHAFEQSESARD